MMKNVGDVFEKHWSSPAFRQVYMTERLRVYRKMFQVASELQAKTILDIGCAYGQFVNCCNAAHMDAWGVDLPINALMQYHKSLEPSGGRFLYGSIEEPVLWGKVAALRKWDLVTCADTMRYLADATCLWRLRARYYLIKENCDNSRNRTRQESDARVRLWSPCDLADLLEGYVVQRIYLPRFFAGLGKPSRWTLRLVNQVMPTYTALLRREGP
jgi:SAM-dependent methyltransferase